MNPARLLQHFTTKEMEKELSLHSSAFMHSSPLPPRSTPVDMQMRIESPDSSCLAFARQNILDYTKKKNIPANVRDAIILTATEIISNILQHPRDRASYISITLSWYADHLTLKISDDSTPFANFDAKCKESLNRVNETGLHENGQGLGLVLKSSASADYISADGHNHFTASKKVPAPEKKDGKDKTADKKFGVFVIDDDDIFREMIVAMLREKYNVISFGRAEDALAAFEEMQPAIVVSDLIMPGMNGIMLRKALSELKNGDTTPFIFLTGHAEAVEASYINQLGIDDFIHKPVKKDQLLAVLERLISRSSQIKQRIEGQVGQDITSVLRPQLPQKFQNWNAEVRNIMADAGGGDCILFAKTDEGASIILADVMGHGIGAKFFAYAYAGYLRSIFYIFWTFNKPGEFLRRLSDCVNRDPFLESRVMTCLALWLTPDGTVTIASAGHPWPVVLRKGKAEAVEVSGPLPGLIGESAYQTVTLKLEPGDRLALYTDGVLDRLDSRKNHLAAIKRVEENMNQTSSVKIDKTADILWTKFLKQDTGKKGIEDDSTLVILEYTKQETT